MFNELDLVKLKNGDPTVGVSPNDVGTVVNVSEYQGKRYYTIEFTEDKIYTNMDALHKDYVEEELIKAN